MEAEAGLTPPFDFPRPLPALFLAERPRPFPALGAWRCGFGFTPDTDDAAPPSGSPSRPLLACFDESPCSDCSDCDLADLAALAAAVIDLKRWLELRTSITVETLRGHILRACLVSFSPWDRQPPHVPERPSGHSPDATPVMLPFSSRWLLRCLPFLLKATECSDSGSPHA